MIALKEMFDKNASDQKQIHQAKSNVHKNKADFEKHNVFSYIYSTKVHKSHSMGKRNEEVINRMKDQFTQ